MIYVTHDQTEALTFADTVVVMHDGRVVQSGTPAELFDKPAHTFVGYFIGSPGMNIVPAEVSGREARIDGHVIGAAPQLRRAAGGREDRDRRAAGIRRRRGARVRACCRPRSSASTISAASASPAFASATPNSPPACRRDFPFPTTRPGSCSIPRMFTSMPTAVWSRGLPDGQDHQPESLVPGAAGVPGGRVLRDPAADDGRELFDAGHLRQQPVLLERRRLVQGTARSLDRSRRALPGLARPQSAVLRHHPRDRGAARHRGGAVDAARGLDASPPAS